MKKIKPRTLIITSNIICINFLVAIFYTRSSKLIVVFLVTMLFIYFFWYKNMTIPLPIPEPEETEDKR